MPIHAVPVGSGVNMPAQKRINSNANVLFASPVARNRPESTNKQNVMTFFGPYKSLKYPNSCDPTTTAPYLEQKKREPLSHLA